MDNIFWDVSLIIIVATLLGYLLKLIKQPLVPAYVLTGLILGPLLHLITDFETIRTLSEIGIAFLLFVVGLELDFKRLRDIGSVATIGGTIQVMITFFFGFVIAIVLGFYYTEAIYLGFIVAFSSTMVVIKMLSDHNELDTLHGRIIIGILLIQDVIAIFALLALNNLDNFTIVTFLLAILKGGLMIGFTILTAKYMFPPVFKFAAKSQELLFMIAITSCFAFAALFTVFGFSLAIGAFLAGVALGNLPYNYEIIGKVTSIKDFFAILFFVSLGLELQISGLVPMLPAILITTAFVLIGKPIVMILSTRLFGYTTRTSAITALSLAQISEFSLILVVQGLALGHLSESMFSLTVLVALITITITSYTIKYDNDIVMFLQPMLRPLKNLRTHKEALEYIPKDRDHEVLLIGYDRIGYSIFKKLQAMKKNFLVIDFNPDIVRRLIRKKIPCIYGDIADPEIYKRLGLENLKWIISTVPDLKSNLLIMDKAKEVNHRLVVFATAYTIDDALELYDKGADYVILPHFLGGDRVAILLEDITFDFSKLIHTKVDHIRDLEYRKTLGHEHPIEVKKYSSKA